jgi:hypothetical protein
MVVASVRERMEALLATLDEQISAIEPELKDVVQQDASWAATAALLLTISGVGLLTATWLLVTTLNFTIGATPEDLTTYVGLAPMLHESGTSVQAPAKAPLAVKPKPERWRLHQTPPNLTTVRFMLHKGLTERVRPGHAERLSARRSLPS